MHITEDISPGGNKEKSKLGNSTEKSSFSNEHVLNFDFILKNRCAVIHKQLTEEVPEIKMGKTYFFIYFSIVNYIELYGQHINLELKFFPSRKQLLFLEKL